MPTSVVPVSGSVFSATYSRLNCDFSCFRRTLGIFKCVPSDIEMSLAPNATSCIKRHMTLLSASSTCLGSAGQRSTYLDPTAVLSSRSPHPLKPTFHGYHTCIFDGLPIRLVACSNLDASTRSRVTRDNCSGFKVPAPKARACCRACQNLRHTSHAIKEIADTRIPEPCE